MSLSTEEALCLGDSSLLAHRVLSRHPQAVLQGLASGSAELQTAFVKQLHRAINAGALDPNTVLNAVPALAASESVPVPCPSAINSGGVEPLLPAVASFVPAPHSLALPAVCRSWYAKRAALKPLGGYHAYFHWTQYYVSGQNHPPRLTRPIAPFHRALDGRSPLAVARDTWALAELQELTLHLNEFTAAQVSAPSAQDAWRHMTKLQKLDVGLSTETDTQLRNNQALWDPLVAMVADMVRANSSTLQTLRVGMHDISLMNIQLPRLTSADFSYRHYSKLLLCNVRWPKLRRFVCEDICPYGSAELATGAGRPEAAVFGDEELPVCVSECFEGVTFLDSLEIRDHNSIAPLLKAIYTANKPALRHAKRPAVRQLPGVGRLELHVTPVDMGTSPDEGPTVYIMQALELCVPRELHLRLPKEEYDPETQMMVVDGLADCIAIAANTNAALRYSHPGTVLEDGARHRFERVVLHFEVEVEHLARGVRQGMDEMANRMAQGEVRLMKETYVERQDFPFQYDVTFARHFDASPSQPSA